MTTFLETKSFLRRHRCCAMPQTVDTIKCCCHMHGWLFTAAGTLLTISYVYQSPTVLEGLCYEFYQQYIMASSIEHNIAVYMTTLQWIAEFKMFSQVTLVATLVPEVLSLFISLDMFLSPATTWTLEQDTSSSAFGRSSSKPLDSLSMHVWVSEERVMLEYLFI